MGFFDKQHEEESPIGKIRAHIGTYMYFVKLGKSKFRHKGRIGEIFFDMDNTQYLLNQATMGSLYDFKKKLDYTLWDAALHKYSQDMDELKALLLKAVDEGAMRQPYKEAEEEKEEPKAEEKGSSGDWTQDIKQEMKAAEEKSALEEKARSEKNEEAPRFDNSEVMTEADCRELWRIIQGLDTEYAEMTRLADDWFAVNGKGGGCFGAAAVFLLLPLGAAYGLYTLIAAVV